MRQKLQIAAAPQWCHEI